MTQTLIASEKKSFLIGFDRPFCVIGERINPTGRKKLAAEMQAGNFETVIKDALAQAEAGANILDVNAGVTSVNPNETEPPLLRQTIEIVQSVTDLPLCIDSSVTAALKVGLETAKGRPLVNSVTGEEEKLEAILPLVAKYNVAVVAISNDETGISEDPDVRFEVAKKIVQRAADYGIKPEDVVVDPPRHADRRHGHGRPAGVSPGAAPARGAEKSTRPVARRISPSACRTGGCSPGISSPWRHRMA